MANIDQGKNAVNKRWFADLDLDLTVWEHAPNQLWAFQLGYARDRREHAVYWQRDQGYRHFGVATAQRPHNHPVTADGPFDPIMVAILFWRRSQKVPSRLRQQIYFLILDYRSEPD